VRQTQFPLVESWTRPFDAALKAHLSEVRDYTHAFHARWQRRGVSTYRNMGWALRPFVLRRAHLDFIASTLHVALSELRETILETLSRKGGLYRALPFHRELQDCLDVEAGLTSPALLSHLRPDGFLFPDRYVLSEINYGNGVMVSCAYTDVVHDYWKHHPVIRRLGWDVDRLHRRPLPRLLNVVQRFIRPSPRPLVALLAHSEEWKVVQSYPPRIMHQIEFAQRELARRGIESKVVTEKTMHVDRRGEVHLRGVRRPADLVMCLTIGSSFADRARMLKPGRSLAHLRGAKVGNVWLVKPFAGLVLDKGTLPLLEQQRFPREAPDGFRFEVGETEFPRGRSPARYTRHRADWVFKRAFDGKDTHVGIARPAQLWGEIARELVKHNTHVAQRYVSIPRARVPVLTDGHHLEFVPSRVELSSFIFDGHFGGAAARHAPDAEGLVMTDPPDNYGFSTVFAV
jgi:hypothetical protein